ncbi:phosphoenolpyruvate synthase [bacterium]|nr:phosphoenolpyruvate synthase [bacterium]
MAGETYREDFLPPSPKVLAIHLELMEYPLLGKKIRERMRKEIVNRGIIDLITFENEVKEKALRSQQREHLADPYTEESEEDWIERLDKMRDILTEFYYAMNFEHKHFLDIVQEVLSHKNKKNFQGNFFPSINPEIAPWKMLFAQANQIENLPEDQKQALQHHLREIIVVLTKGMLSDQLSFVGIAKNVLKISDLEWIFRHRIGRGKIGGKAGGMMLAKSILHNPDPDDPVDFQKMVTIPDSYFLGSDVIYDFVQENNIIEMVQIKYKPFDQINAEYPELVEKFVAAHIPERYRNQLHKLLQEVGQVPLIVRSSSLLEDNFGIAFAGKYESYFCPNQGSIEENLTALCEAIKKVYASIVSPTAIAYRIQKGLIDYDERMAILIQKVEGQRFGDYFFPVIAGVGFSHNPFVWNARIDRNSGFLRIVTGLGTRAVDRLGNDYAKMVALSHPTLQPVKSSFEKLQYSQKFMDVINLKANTMETVHFSEVIDWHFPHLPMIGSVHYDRELHPILMLGPGTIDGQIVITLENLLKNVQFVAVMNGILRKLERHYQRPVDIEFTVEILSQVPFKFQIHLLQCRQQSKRIEEHEFLIPTTIPKHKLVLVSKRMVTTGRIINIRYVIYIDPEKYNTIESDFTRIQLARTVGQLNTILGKEIFILVGPGRWGSSNLNLGVPVTYADIFNARALVEIAIPYGDAAPEASYGTHFFQDLVESNIYPLPIYPDEQGSRLEYDFFRSSPNILSSFIPGLDDFSEFISVIDVKAVTNGCVLEIIMNAQQEEAVCFITCEIKEGDLNDYGPYKRVRPATS